MIHYVAVLLIAAGVAAAMTPGVVKMSRRLGAIDTPEDRKVHAVPTPTLGGVAIFAGFAVAFLASAALEPFAPSFRPMLVWPLRETMGVLVGAAIIFALGVVDDLKGLKAPAKLAGQMLAAGIVFLLGVRLEYFRFPVGSIEAVSLDPNSSAIVTIAWIVIVCNAVNLIDGLDGLAAGITAIAGASFFLYTYQIGRLGLAGPEPTAQLISIAIVGATLGFLRYNFNPARIFMGDSGSMTLGFLLAAATVIGVGRTAPSVGSPATEGVLFYLPLVIPLVALAVPILDTLMAIARRTAKGRPVFHADKEHIHHRLLDIGHGHRQAVLIMYAWTAIIAGLTLAITFREGAYAAMFATAAIALILYTVLPRLLRQ